MPSRNRGTTCDCCCGAPPVINVSCHDRIFNASGGLTTPATALHNTTRTHLNVLSFSPSAYTVEALGGGSAVAVADNITMPSQDTIETSRLDITASASGDFTSGVILWPTSAISFNQRDEYDGEQFRHLNGYLAHRNGLVSEQQEYTATTSVSPDDLKTGLPVLLTGLAVEIDGVVTYSNLTTPGYDRCWRSSGWAWGSITDYDFAQPNNAWSIAGDGKPTHDQLFDIRCFLSAAVDDIDRIGFVVALSSWHLVGSTWTSLSLGAVSHTERLWVAKPQITSCWQDQCDCWHNDLLTLEAEIDGANNPEEFIGEVVTLTRSYGSTEFTGSVSKPSNNRPDIQRLQMDEDDGPIDETIFTYEINFTYGNHSQAGPLTPNLTLSRISNEPTAAQVEAKVNAVIAAYGGSETVTCSGGPLPTAPIDITSDSDVLLNWIKEVVTSSRVGPGTYVDPHVIIHRTQHGIPSVTLTAEFTLRIGPDKSSAGTDNLTARQNRSCTDLLIEAGATCDYTDWWAQNAPIPGSQSPYARTFTRTGGGTSLDSYACSVSTKPRVMNMMEAGYEQAGGYGHGVSNLGTPAGGVQTVSGSGWNIVVTEP